MIRELRNNLFSFIVLGFLIFPGILFLISFTSTDLPSSVKNQKLKTRLKYYYENVFPIKTKIITFNNKLQFNYLNSRELNGVHIGLDGWLFLSPQGRENAIGLMKGNNPITKLELSRARKYIEKYTKQFPTYMVAIPNKHTVYKDKLSPYLDFSNYRKNESAYELFSKEFKSVLGVKYIDLEKSFRQLRILNEFLYQKLDTHWNELASYHSFKMIMNSFSHDFEMGDISNEVSYRKIVNKSGDLKGLLERGSEFRLESHYSDNPQVFVDYMKSPCLVLNADDARGGNIRDYAVFECSKKKLKLYIIGDSFMFFNWLKYFPNHFNVTVFMKDDKYLEQTIIKYGKPDILLIERVERGLRRLGI